MTDIAGFINGLNQFTQTVGAVQGAMETLSPAVSAVDQSINQIAAVFTEDQYYPPVYPTYPAYPPMPIVSLEEGKVGMIGKMMAGAVSGAATHRSAADAIQTLKNGHMGQGFKQLGLSSLKAGGIGAAVTGVMSAAKNISLVNQGMQTSSDATGNIAADTIGGLLAGAGAGVGAGAASLALSGMGVAGLGVTIGAAVAGAVGAAGVGALYDATARDSISNGIRSMMGGNDYGQYAQNYQDPYAYGDPYAHQQGYAPQAQYYGY